MAICHRRHGVTEFVVREACLETVVREVQSLGVVHLVLESRQDDRDDAPIITRVRRPDPLFVFEHRAARNEPMLGVADGITCAAGAGAGWFATIEPLVHRAIELRP